MTREVLFRCLHGSHLYGTAGPGSDLDIYEVVVGRPAGDPWVSRYGYSRQSVGPDRDLVRKDLGTWLREVQAGVPQACEAAWAPDECVEVDKIRELRLGLRLGSSSWNRHRRAMRNFATGYWSGGDASGTLDYAMKRARHAVRLSLSLQKLREAGRYNPRMTAAEADRCRRVAANLGPGTDLLELCDGVALWDR